MVFAFEFLRKTTTEVLNDTSFIDDSKRQALCQPKNFLYKN